MFNHRRVVAVEESTFDYFPVDLDAHPKTSVRSGWVLDLHIANPFGDLTDTFSQFCILSAKGREPYFCQRPLGF